MPNSLGNAVPLFTANLDEVLEAESLTTDLNMNEELFVFKGNGKCDIPKMSMDGLGNYSRANGFVAGDVTLEWEEKTLAYDRGREFAIDVIDDEERASVVSMNVMSEFVRTKVVPEVDAIRFARLAGAAPAGQTLAKTFSGSTAEADAKDAVLDAEAAIEDNGLKLNECVIYMTSAFKKLLKAVTPHSWGNESGPSRNFETYDDMKVVTVPQSRFYTALTLNDGTTGGQEDGGYEKASGAKDINFMIVHPMCCGAIARHEKLRYFDPDVNQDANAHLFQYRVYHDLLTLANKANCIYLAKKA